MSPYAVNFLQVLSRVQSIFVLGIDLGDLQVWILVTETANSWAAFEADFPAHRRVNPCGSGKGGSREGSSKVRVKSKYPHGQAGSRDFPPAAGTASFLWACGVPERASWAGVRQGRSCVRTKGVSLG